MSQSMLDLWQPDCPNCVDSPWQDENNLLSTASGDRLFGWFSAMLDRRSPAILPGLSAVLFLLQLLHQIGSQRFQCETGQPAQTDGLELWGGVQLRLSMDDGRLSGEGTKCFERSVLWQVDIQKVPWHPGASIGRLFADELRRLPHLMELF